MKQEQGVRHFGILGGGPSALFMYKRLIESELQNIAVTIFEKKNQLGSGMPYSNDGANREHVTNVSDNEIPELVNTVQGWIENASQTAKSYQITADNFNEYKVMPRLLFGEYLINQFELLQQQAKKRGIVTTVFLSTTVNDIIDNPDDNSVTVVTTDAKYNFSQVIICTGHVWPKKFEGKIENYFDSPYPPSKLRRITNYPVALRGASLTAIDALRTLARCNGQFTKGSDGFLSYTANVESQNFKMVMHSRNGLLPALRFHLEDSHLSKDSVLSAEEVNMVMTDNGGFIPLDYLFNKNFKEPIREQDPEFYAKIKDMSIEEFVDAMMALRERLDPFVLLKAEYAEAEKSIKRRQSVYWKEELAVLSFAMNYPAKHFSAEDMMRLQKVLMPLISVVIAFVPQSSAQELIALHDAGVLSLVSVGDDSKVEPQTNGGIIYHYSDEDGQQHEVPYKMFVDCIGQPHLSYHDFPFKSLLSNGSISPAKLQFKSIEEGLKQLNKGNDKVEQDATGNFWLQVPGLTINDSFQVLDKYGAYNSRIYCMAVPYISGYNPDYSGLDFGEAASAKIVKAIVETAAVPEEKV